MSRLSKQQSIREGHTKRHRHNLAESSINENEICIFVSINRLFFSAVLWFLGHFLSDHSRLPSALECLPPLISGV